MTEGTEKRKIAPSPEEVKRNNGQKDLSQELQKE